MLLSGMIRGATITGRSDYIRSWLGEKQGGRYAERVVQGVVPSARPRSASQRDLDELRERGVVTKAEYEKLRKRL
jgi:hypothetical protein